MLIKELKARESVKRILILVPPLVLKQWQMELEEKFGEYFRIINRSTLREYGGKNPFNENDLCLASQHEINELNRLINKTSYLKQNIVERKYEELEQTLFGVNGLLNHNEKIIIFTESVDTLHFLERRLLERVPKVAKIIGKLSIEERTRQVELIEKECPPGTHDPSFI